MSKKDTKNDNSQKLKLRDIIQSTLAAAFGVQSSKNREKDFEHGNLWVYIGAGVIFTLIFIFSVLGLVRLALAA